jgi:sec-independent protein translocase protein TatB
MFDFAGSEIAVIGVVALVLIGPKDMPIAIRTIARTLKKVRRLAGEFQQHMDEMVCEADLGDVQSTFRDLSSMNLKQVIANAVDHDGSLSRAFDEPAGLNRMPPEMSEAPASKPTPTVAILDGPVPSFIPPLVGQPAFASAGR